MCCAVQFIMWFVSQLQIEFMEFDNNLTNQVVIAISLNAAINANKKLRLRRNTQNALHFSWNSRLIESTHS